jgi:hypothetical protein
VISVIERTSKVRRACFDAIEAIGEQVRIFYSVQSFVDTGAIFASDVVVLGLLPLCTQQCEPLLWASSVRPKLTTLLLGEASTLKRNLSDVCDEARIISVDDDPAFRIAAIQRIARSGVLERSSKIRSLYPRPALYEVA